MNVRFCKIVGVLKLAPDMMSMYKTRHSYKILREYCTKEGTKRVCSEKVMSSISHVIICI